jgi:hypothetical protein
MSSVERHFGLPEMPVLDMADLEGYIDGKPNI